jgi:hypothetical protein
VSDTNVKTIDLTPSTTGYIYLLKVVINNSTNTSDVEWAKRELTQFERELNKSAKGDNA